MTVQEVLAQTDAVKPNQFEEGMKLVWLNEVEGRVYQVMKLRKGSEDVKEPHISMESMYNDCLLLPESFSGIYVHYLSAMIDYFNGETARYNNSMYMFNTAWSEFENYWYREHGQVSDGSFGKQV